MIITSMAIAHFPSRPEGTRVATKAMRNWNFFVKYLSLLMLIMVLSGCSRNAIPTPDPERPLDSAVIVVPGFYGTRLVRESDGSLVFISFSQALFGNQTLTIPVPGLGFEGTIDLQPDGILNEVRMIPPFYSVDIYGSLLEQLKFSGKENREVVPFTYDWRGDLMEAVQRLDVLIHRLRDEGKKNISVVAHSMGGLIVSYYLRYGTQDIESAKETWEGAELLQNVVLAGVPYLGVMNSFRNMNFGITVGWNSSLLSSEAYASFPASYYTLPVAGTDVLLTPELQPLTNIVRNPRHWEESRWGLLQSPAPISHEIFERRAAYISYWLHRSQRFLELLQAPLARPAREASFVLYVYGRGEDTLAKAVWMRNEDRDTYRLFFNGSDAATFLPTLKEDLLLEDGDGTVTILSAILPEAYHQAFRVTVKDYEVDHTEMVRRPDIQQDILSFLDGQMQAK